MHALGRGFVAHWWGRHRFGAVFTAAAEAVFAVQYCRHGGGVSSRDVGRGARGGGSIFVRLEFNSSKGFPPDQGCSRTEVA